MTLTPGTIVGDGGPEAGRYVVEGVLGRGGSATVYAVTHRVLGSAHALKILDTGADPGAHTRLLAEGRLQARLSHPNLVRVTDVIALRDGVGLVMDRVEGETLRARLDRGPPPLPEAVDLGAKILAGVRAAHAAGLVHGDLKPANILLDRAGNPRLADFGLARASGEPGRPAGTLGYLAPEVADGAPADPRADLFSLGCVLYEILAGTPAFPADGTQPARAREGDYLPIEARVPALPAHLAVAVGVALSPEPEGRPKDVGTLAALWGADAPSVPGATPPAAIPAVPESPSTGAPGPGASPAVDRRGWFVALAVASLLGAGIAAALVTREDPATPAWNPAVAAAFAERLTATGQPHAANVVRLTKAELDRWYEREARERGAWITARDADPDALEPRQHLACLDVARQLADGIVANLLAGDADRLVDAGTGNPFLPDLDLCATESGRLAWSLPEDPAARAQAAALYARPLDCLHQSWLQREADAEACYAALTRDAEALGFAPARIATRATVLGRRQQIGPLDREDRRELDTLVAEADGLGLEVELADLLLLAATAGPEAPPDVAAGPRGEEALARARVLVKRLGWPTSLHLGLLDREREAAKTRGRWQEASAVARAAVDLRCERYGEVSADCAWAHLNHAEALFDEGRVDEMLAEVEESLRLYRTALGPTHREQCYPRYYGGLYLVWTGRLAEASALLEPIPTLAAGDPGYLTPRAHLLRAVCALGLGDPDRARSEQDAAIVAGQPLGEWEPIRVALERALGELPADGYASVEAAVMAATDSHYRCSPEVGCPAFHRCVDDTCAPIPAERPLR